MSWPESVDQALCFGWIDGVRRNVDAERYTIRFTPRKPGSIWSKVNIAKVCALREKGLMTAQGEAVFSKRNPEKSGIYSFENEAKTLSRDLEKKFRSNAEAWSFFGTQPPGYRKQMIFRIMSAKQEKTRHIRLEKLIAASAQGKRLD